MGYIGMYGIEQRKTRSIDLEGQHCGRRSLTGRDKPWNKLDKSDVGVRPLGASGATQLGLSNKQRSVNNVRSSVN
jgi:hypothetical protein